MNLMLRSYKKPPVLIIIAILLLTLAACHKADAKPQEKSLDSTLVKNNTCEPPCWNGIIPGKSTYSEAVSVLDKLKNSNPGSYKDAVVGERKVISWTREGRKHIEILMDEVVVHSVCFSGTSGTLDDILQVFGEPDNFYRGRTIDSPDIFWIELYYPQKGLNVSVRGKVQPGKQIFITPEMPVTLVLYSVPGTMEELLVYTHGEQWKSVRLQEWKGYGEINLFP